VVRLDENTIEDFIRENKDKFCIYRPPEGHLDKFLLKINYKIKHIVSIIPYLIRVAVATVIIFITSIIVWNNFIRKDRNEITLKNKTFLFVKKLPIYHAPGISCLILDNRNNIILD
jgi:hypothetical protein